MIISSVVLNIQRVGVTGGIHGHSGQSVFYSASAMNIMLKAKHCLVLYGVIIIKLGVMRNLSDGAFFKRQGKCCQNTNNILQTVHCKNVLLCKAHTSRYGVVWYVCCPISCHCPLWLLTLATHPLCMLSNLFTGLSVYCSILTIYCNKDSK